MPFQRLINELDKNIPDYKVIDEILRVNPSFISKIHEIEGMTPIMIAAMRGNYPLVHHLMGWGAKLTEKSSTGQTALIVAAYFGDFHLAELAIHHGVDPFAKDNDDQDAKYYAEENLKKQNKKYLSLKQQINKLAPFNPFDGIPLHQQLDVCEKELTESRKILQYIYDINDKRKLAFWDTLHLPKREITKIKLSKEQFQNQLQPNKVQKVYARPKKTVTQPPKSVRPTIQPSPMPNPMPNGNEIKINQEELLIGMKKLKQDWLKLRKKLKDMMFNEVEWGNERQKIRDLKKAHPFKPLTADFLTATPRIIAEKTIMQRDSQHIEKYHALYKQIRHCPMLIMLSLLKKLNIKKEDIMEEYAAYALLMANQHHLLAQFCQDASNTDGIAEYISLKVQRLSRNDGDLSLVTPKIQEIMMHEIQEARHGKVLKREQYNRSLPVDLENDPHIQNLKKLGFEMIRVQTRQTKDTKLKIKKTAWNSNHRVISDNAIVIDDKTGRVLGILLNGQLTKQQIEPIITNLKTANPKKIWERDSRKGRIGDPARGAAHKVNQGKQATFGRLNFRKKKNNLSQTTKYSPKIWEQMVALNPTMKTIFQRYLPVTYQSILTQTEELRSAGLFIDPNSPFATVSVNLKNSVKAHRDHNFHNYAAMFVYESEGEVSNALTCFPEWIIADSVAGTEQNIAFQVGNLAVLLADTDYVHHVPEVTTERVSMVWYAYKDLATPSFLLCEDSDLDDDDYEPSPLQTQTVEGERPKKKQKSSVSDFDSKKPNEADMAVKGYGAGPQQNGHLQAMQDEEDDALMPQATVQQASGSGAGTGSGTDLGAGHIIANPGANGVLMNTLLQFEQEGLRSSKYSLGSLNGAGPSINPLKRKRV